MIPAQPSSPTRLALLALTLTSTHAPAQPSFECQPPQIIGILDGLTNPTAMTIEGNYAYIVEDAEFFTIVDLSDPAAPSVVGRTEIYDADPQDITIIADAAYLQDDHEFLIYNIEDKTDPWFRRYYSGLDNARNLIPRTDSHIFLGYEFALNIQRPLAPGADAYETSLDPFDDEPVYVQGNVLVTQSRSRYDITDPLNPTLISQSPGATISIGNKLEPPYVIAYDNASVAVTNAQAPTLYPATTTVTTMGSTDASVRGDLVFAANGTIDVYATADEPILIASFQLADDFYAQGIEQLGEHFAVLSDQQLAICSINTNPISGARSSAIQSRITKHGNLLITSSDAIGQAVYGANIIDASNPLRPQWVAQLPLDSQNQRPLASAAVADTLYVAERNSGLLAFDIADPRTPIPLGTYPTNTDPKAAPVTTDVAILADIAYVTDQDAGLLVYQIEPDTSLTPLASMPTNDARAINLMQDIAFLSTGQDAHLIDITDPTNPQALSIIEARATSSVPNIPAAHREGNFLYTADIEHGYRIFDITDPADPIELAQFDADVSTPQGDFEAFVYDILVEGDLLYVAMSSGGFAIYDNTNIFAPVLLAHAPAKLPQGGSNTRYREFIKEGSSVYIAAGEPGIRILSLDGCTIPCAIDYNTDGVLDFFDVTEFIVAFNNQDPAADLNNDDEFNFFDITAFIVAFQNGCP